MLPRPVRLTVTSLIVTSSPPAVTVNLVNGRRDALCGASEFCGWLGTDTVNSSGPVGVVGVVGVVGAAAQIAFAFARDEAPQ